MSKPSPTKREAASRRSTWARLVACMRATRRVTVCVWRFANRHPWATSALPAAMAVALLYGAKAVAAVGALAVAGLAGWWGHDPAGFRREVIDRARTGWRWELVYHRRWTEAMALNSLAKMYQGREVVPRLEAVRCAWAADVLTIREAPGQAPDMWETRAPDLAETFGALSGRVRRLQPGRITLELVTHRNTGVVDPLPVPPVDELDLEAVPVARAGDGSVWSLPIAERNVLVVGRQGAAKTEGVEGSLTRGLAAGVHAGQVVLWAGDPRSGSALAHGPDGPDGEPICPLFTRWARTEEAVCELVFDALEVMYAREAQLRRAHVRKYSQSPDMPTVVLFIDELMSITKRNPDRQLAAEVSAALELLLSRARSVGIIVVACVQDPRQDTVPFADLFQVVVCMGVKRPALVDVVLGPGAHALGAHADRIPTGAAGAGQAYVADEADDTDVPLWVRFSYVDRATTDQTAETYPTPWAWHPARGLYQPAQDPPAVLAVCEHLASVLHTPATAGARVVDITDRLPASPTRRPWAVDTDGQTTPAAPHPQEAANQ